jgi:peptidyl-prolyl cis-trans isomerase SurA
MKRVMSATNEATTTVTVLLLLAILLFTSPAPAQQGRAVSGKEKPAVLAKIGTYDLTLDEFERQFIRNNGGEAAAVRSSREERLEFLDLLIKYRLKVHEARSKGFDKDAEIIRELEEYRNSLAIPYFTERALIDPKIRELHDLQQEEVRAAHILIRVANDSLGIPDSAAAMAKAVEVLRKAKDGADFAALAVEHSDDRGTSERGGDLLYFSAGMTVPAFDKAVYSMKTPGEIYPEPVRTMFGYHVVKLLERRPARGELQVSHILVRIDPENPTDTAAAYEKAVAIRDSLSKGRLFSDLALLNSEDPGSAARGGDLGWVGRRKFVPEFELAVFQLKEGQVGGPVRTQFGYHIITVTGERPPTSFEDAKQELKELYRRYSYEADNRAFLENIYSSRNIRIEEKVFRDLFRSVDSVATTSAPGWYNKISDKLRAATLIKLKGGTVTIDQAIRIIERNQDLQSQPLNSASLRNVIEMIGQKEALRLETADLETRYPEFGDLMREYQEGVLLFRAEQDAVWNQVTVDEERLREFWEVHRADYTWPERVRFSEIFVTSDSVAAVLRDSLDNQVDFGELAARHTQRAGFDRKDGDWGFQPIDANELSRKANAMQVGWVEGPMKFQYGYSIIKKTGTDIAREKTFEEAQSEVSSRFQEFESKRLENEWIDGLRKRFGVTINENILDNAFAKLTEGRS